MRRRTLLLSTSVLLLAATAAVAADLRAPEQVTAGTPFTIATSGSGKGTFYLIGPANIVKRDVDLSGGIGVQPEDVEQAGRYTAIVCSDQCSGTSFYVQAAKPSRISLLVHPSRVPVADPNAISAVAFVFDRFHNLELQPEDLEFSILGKTGATASEKLKTVDGRAWIRLTSAHHDGPAKIGVSIGNASEIRVVQQVAADACNLHIKPEWSGRTFWVETDPVRDCSGNNIPDGTVVSFTMTDSAGKTTVDVPIKKGIAKVEMPISGPARITVASGVVTGNELYVAGRHE